MCSEFQITDLLVNFYNISIYNSRDMDKVDKFFCTELDRGSLFCYHGFKFSKKKKNSIFNAIFKKHTKKWLT